MNTLTLILILGGLFLTLEVLSTSAFIHYYNQSLKAFKNSFILRKNSIKELNETIKSANIEKASLKDLDNGGNE